MREARLRRHLSFKIKYPCIYIWKKTPILELVPSTIPSQQVPERSRLCRLSRPLLHFSFRHWGRLSRFGLPSQRECQRQLSFRGFGSSFPYRPPAWCYLPGWTGLRERTRRLQLGDLLRKRLVRRPASPIHHELLLLPKHQTPSAVSFYYHYYNVINKLKKRKNNSVGLEIYNRRGLGQSVFRTDICRISMRLIFASFFLIRLMR